MQVTIRQFVKDLSQGLGQASLAESVKLGKGQCKNHEEYKLHVGIIAGYDRAAVLADQMLRQVEETEHDESLPTMDPQT